jgi:hypothetical protein
MAARRFVAFSAEFPNDNADLHTGTIWMCVDLCGPAEAHLPEEVDGEDAELALEPIEIVESIELEGPIEEVPLPVPALAEMFAGSEFTPESLPLPAPLPVIAAEAPVVVATGEAPVLAGQHDDFFPPETLEPEMIDRPVPLVSTAPPAMHASPFETFLQTMADVACEAGHTYAALEIAAALKDDAVASAWRSILCGESEDFSLCATPLDEWASATLARIVAAPHKAGHLRRELRARGIAAFGMVEAA